MCREKIFTHPFINHRSLTEPNLQTIINFSCLSTRGFGIYLFRQVVTSRRVDTLGAAEPHSASRSPPLFRRSGQVQVSPAGKVGEPHSTSQLFFPRFRSLCAIGGSLGKVTMI